MEKRAPVRLVLLFNPASAGLRSLVDGIVAVKPAFSRPKTGLPGAGPKANHFWRRIWPGLQMGAQLRSRTRGRTRP